MTSRIKLVIVLAAIAIVGVAVYSLTIGKAENRLGQYTKELSKVIKSMHQAVTNSEAVYYKMVNKQLVPISVDTILLEHGCIKDGAGIKLLVPVKTNALTSTTTSPKPRSLRYPPEGLTLLQLDALYLKKVTEIQVNAKHKRYGNAGDGGWEMCTEPGFELQKGCIVYSFGINWDWSFDDAIDKLDLCEIHSFDPSMKLQDSKRNKNINFHHLGISGKDGMMGQWPVKTLSSIRKQLGHTDKVIDLMKIDVEFSEWYSLETALLDGSLDNIKQLGIEYHLPELAGNKLVPKSTIQTYRNEIGIMNSLEDLGFKTIYSHTNPTGYFRSSITNTNHLCCNEGNAYIVTMVTGRVISCLTGLLVSFVLASLYVAIIRHSAHRHQTSAVCQ